MKTALVLGGGGVMGAHEVGMLWALTEAGIKPDVVMGTSVGAIDKVRSSPAIRRAPRNVSMSSGTALTCSGAFSGTLLSRTARLARYAAACPLDEAFAAVLEEALPGRRLRPTSSSRSTAWRPASSGPAPAGSAAGRWVPAVLASCAVPGLLPPVELDGHHYFDGGLVHSIPVGRAIELGASIVYVLHVGRIERPLAPGPTGCGRWDWSPSRSPAGTGSTKRWPPCPRT